MTVKTVAVSNLSLTATQQNIKEFFSFSGNIEYVELKSESERSQFAYVTFKESKGAETSLLLSGATIMDMPVNITLATDYRLPPEASTSTTEQKKTPTTSSDTAAKKAEDMVINMLAKGFVLGKDTLNKAKALDERHKLISNASIVMATIDSKIGLMEKVKVVDDRFQVSGKTRSAIAVAEQKANTLMSNPLVSTGAAWVSSKINKVATAAEGAAAAKEKGERTEEEKEKEALKQREAGDTMPVSPLPVSTLDKARV